MMVLHAMSLYNFYMKSAKMFVREIVYENVVEEYHICTYLSH